MGWSADIVELLLAREEDDSRGLTVVPLVSFGCSFSGFSPFAPIPPKSGAVPGVLGVFDDAPNEAKAPDPRPKAEEAPAVGDARLLVERGVMPFSGFVLLLKESKRLAD